MRRKARIMGAVAVTAMLISAVPASALPKDQMLTRLRAPVVNDRANEYAPAADDGYVSWTASPARRPGRFRVYFTLDGGSRRRANPPGTKADNGGIDGTTLVYTLFGGGESDLVLYDMATETDLTLPDGVNTSAREHSSSISGDYLLFDRDDFIAGHRVEDIVLYNSMTDEEIILAHSETNNKFFESGQVNGNWAVYFRCQASGACDVFRYDIGGQETVIAPNVPGLQQYSPSVADDGTVYFVRSKPQCGQAVRYMVWDGSSDPTLFNDFRPRRDSFDSYYEDATDVLYYEKIRCTDGASGIFKKPASAGPL